MRACTFFEKFSFFVQKIERIRLDRGSGHIGRYQGNEAYIQTEKYMYIVIKIKVINFSLSVLT